MCEEKNEQGRGPEALQDRLLKKRKVFIFGKIDDKKAEQIIASLIWLNEENGDPITVLIDSEGGNETDILAIYDVMTHLECAVETLCVGKAHGLAALLLAAGNKGVRKAYQNSEVMLEQVNRGRTFGQASDIELETDHLLRQKQRIISLLSKATGNSVEKISADMERKYWLFAEEAKAYGLVDAIVE